MQVCQNGWNKIFVLISCKILVSFSLCVCVCVCVCVVCVSGVCVWEREPGGGGGVYSFKNQIHTQSNNIDKSLIHTHIHIVLLHYACMHEVWFNNTFVLLTVKKSCIGDRQIFWKHYKQEVHKLHKSQAQYSWEPNTFFFLNSKKMKIHNCTSELTVCMQSASFQLWSQYCSFWQSVKMKQWKKK